jgi:hypothetical protein
VADRVVKKTMNRFEILETLCLVSQGRLLAQNPEIEVDEHYP